MGLGGALQIGRTGLVASQAAIEVTGNNLSNAATRGYHRQTVALTSAGNQEIQRGMFVGRGVQLQQIVRVVDQALEGRIRNSVADEAAATARQDILIQIESLQNELSDNDLSSQLTAFFNAWDDLANHPQDNSLRTLLLQQASSMTGFVRNLRSGLIDMRTQTDQSINDAATAANDLLTQIAALNQQIVQAEGGTGGANGLRDQRDLLLSELSQYVDISTVEHAEGSTDVFIGSLPVILGSENRGVEIRRKSSGDELTINLVLSSDGSVLQPGSGRLGALLTGREQDINQAIDALDEFARQLIWQVNRIHTQSQGASGFAQVTSGFVVEDSAALLNSEAAGLEFAPTHGSFDIHVTQNSTGQRVASTINIDLDGIGGNDTTLDSLIQQINDQTDHITASLTTDGRLKIQADTGDFTISFSDDSSGVLAALGINNFFSGSSASDINVAQTVQGNPSFIAIARDHVVGDNHGALAIADLQGKSLADLGGQSLTQMWSRHVEDYAVRLGQVNQQVQSNSIVRENLVAQQQAYSGVNVDEETINLMAYQRSYQASARFLNVVDELMDTLLALM